MRDPITAFGRFLLRLFRRPKRAAAIPAAPEDSTERQMEALRAELERMIAADSAGGGHG